MDKVSREVRSKIMAQVPSEHTSLEKRVRAAIHAHGFRYRLHASDLPGKPDIVFRSRKKVIFVHGCFWHQHPKCPRARRPASNEAYWDSKLQRNVERDKEARRALKHLGYGALVIWECQTKDLRSMMNRIIRFLDT